MGYKLKYYAIYFLDVNDNIFFSTPEELTSEDEIVDFALEHDLLDLNGDPSRGIPYEWAIKISEEAYLKNRPTVS